MNQKKMPPEAAAELDQVERIIAHLEENYELLEQDEEYFDRINLVFKLIHGEEKRDVARKKITAVLGKGNHTKIMDDCVRVYGDFFIINTAAMRVIQEKRHERVYEAAMKAQDFQAAERALKAIDQLHRLYTRTGDMPITNRKLPKVKLVTDPAALENIAADARSD